MHPDIDASWKRIQTLWDSGDSAGALDQCRRALAHDHLDRPTEVLLRNAVGVLLKQQGQLDAAIESYQKALKLDPDAIGPLRNLAIAYRSAARDGESIDCCRRALEKQPSDAEAHMNLALSLLITGELVAGFQEYEWRWRTRDCAVRKFPRPIWNGEPLGGKTIFVHSEQGFGDTIQFVRYLAGVKELGATVIFGCQKPLANLLGNIAGVDVTVTEGNRIPIFDVHCPLLSLPRIFQTSLDTIPGGVPYLHPDADLVASWKEKLSRIAGRKIGICWQGRETFADDHRRSVRLEHFQRLSAIPDVTLVSLQKGAGSEQLESFENRLSVISFGDTLDTDSGAFMDTAAIMSQLDLVVTPDTASAHLAGALGVPVWIALDYGSEWRWMREREDSPWYPTARLFRQKRIGGWDEVFERISTELGRTG